MKVTFFRIGLCVFRNVAFYLSIFVVIFPNLRHYRIIFISNKLTRGMMKRILYSDYPTLYNSGFSLMAWLN